MKILALDPAKLCGWAWQDTNDPQTLKHGVWNIGTAGELGAQHERLASLLTMVIASTSSDGVDMIAVENAGFGANNRMTQSQHDERLGIIRSIAFRYSLKLQAFHPTTIKSFATGSGSAKKPQMVSAAAKLLGLRNLTEDEADACWILELAKRPDCWPQPAAKKPRAKAFRSTKAAKKSGRLF